MKPSTQKFQMVLMDSVRRLQGFQIHSPTFLCLTPVSGIPTQATLPFFFPCHEFLEADLMGLWLYLKQKNKDLVHHLKSVHMCVYSKAMKQILEMV